MIPFKAAVANRLWRHLCEPARQRFQQALVNPAAAQAAVLQRILRRHSRCVYGQQVGASPDMAYAEFSQAVPVANYADLAPFIERAKLGERDVLCRGDIRAFERTSGTTSGAKWIPFTDDLRLEFREAVRAWMGDLYQRHPELADGRAWWVVSQLPSAASVTSGGIPIGLATDDEYLGWWERKFASWLRVAHTHDLPTAARELSSAPDLRLISVWNPSYLLLLLAQLPAISPQALWPNLKVISGWADASAGVDAEVIQQLFPHVSFQPKGLLATEGVITIPWGAASNGSLPALHSHFLEFQNCQSRAICRVHELSLDQDYEVILTTSGGLWRYRLQDVVRVTGWEQHTPRLRFLGRADGGCDFRGEKLDPFFVQSALQKLTASFAMLAPAQATSTPGYVLFTSDPQVQASALEAALRANPYYAHAVKVGQLAPSRTFLVTDPAPSRRYLERCIQLGQRSGTVKPTALHAHPGWEHWFSGEFQCEP